MEGCEVAVVAEATELAMTIPKPLPREKRPKRPIARKARPRKVRKTSRGKLTREADRLFSLIVREPGRCWAFGRQHAGPLQCAHILSRSYRSVRWEEDNAVPLCAGCHRFYTSRPVEWRGDIIAWMGREILEALEQRALEPWDKDIESVLARLRARAEELGIK